MLEQEEPIAKELGQITNKIDMIKQNIKNDSQKIAELGVIPSSRLYEKFKSHKIKQLFKTLEEIKRNLKPFE